MADIEFEDATPLTAGVYSLGAQKVGSTTAFRHVDNISASSSPGVGDDDGDGYHPGSMWFRIDTGELWVCRDASTGAAVWHRVNGPLFDIYIAGNYYHFPFTSGTDSATATVTAAADTLKAFPFVLPKRCAISHLWSRVGTQNGNWAMAIYNANATTLLPTTALASNTAGAVPAAGNGEFALSAAAQIEPGRVYWAAINFSGSTATTANIGGGSAPMGKLVGNSTLANIQGSAGQGLAGLSYATQTAGTWNDLTAVSPSATLTTTAMHLMGFKCSAVP